ncbi:hypothetical protein DERF_012782 [Dermatophagoides farinae]|uniref:Uncharacterized protein n=1 Tax=Dermatophagoides farinae TaxID=6954 RepID=A0A922KY02_DERFA|nr:hypothetical protein DERF_012782 [Dermatophagoides farinae]
MMRCNIASSLMLTIVELLLFLMQKQRRAPNTSQSYNIHSAIHPIQKKGPIKPKRNEMKRSFEL